MVKEEVPKVSVADPARKRFDASGSCSSAKEDGCACLHEGDSSLVSAKPESKGAKALRALNQIPEDILQDPALNEAISHLPANYNFELHKSVWHLRKAQAKRVALQMPEGLLIFSELIASILQEFAQVRTVILGDVTYGACCVDDLTAAELGCDFLIHYGHSCLIPISQMVPSVKVLYVFVEIGIDNEHLIQLIRANWEPEARIALLGTVQFIAALQYAKQALKTTHPNLHIPQARPLSPGEVLGCTSPRLPADTQTIIFVADGRFHLEASMIANPGIPAFRYDPYSKVMTREHYDHVAMRRLRREAIQRAREAKTFGLILGTLGRQGSVTILEELKGRLKERGYRVFTYMMTEVKWELMKPFDEHVDAWVQVACPRLSIDWGHQIHPEGKPVLSPYELSVVLGTAKPFWEDEDLEAAPYPMDYYAKDSSGPWTVNYKPPKQLQ